MTDQPTLSPHDRHEIKRTSSEAPKISEARNAALREAAALARANTSAPRIWQDGKWHNPHGEEIARAIEALMVKA